MATFDHVFDYVGSQGLYQWRIFLLLCVTAFPCSIHTYLNTFIFATPEHRCRLSPSDNAYSYGNSSKEEALDHFIPLSADNKTRDSCHFYAHSGYFPLNSSLSPNASILPCTDYIYKNIYYPDNVVTHLNLVCDKENMVAMANSFVFVGMLLGSIIFGDISDRFGRATALCSGILGLLIFGVSTAFMKSYWPIVIFRTLSMSCSYGVALSSFVLMIEFFGLSVRTTVCVLAGLCFGVGTMLIGAIAYYVRPWVWLQLSASVPLAAFLVYFVIIPESPRWLLNKGKLIRFKKVIYEMASTNKRTIPQAFVDDLVKDVLSDKSTSDSISKSVSVISIARYPNLLLKTLILCFAWFVINTVYYGITMNLTSMPGSPFFKVVISGAVEVPAHLVLWGLLYLIGRRPILALTMILAGLSCFLCAWVKNDNFVLALAMFGKFCISASFTVVYIFSGELFPTCLRTSGLGLCSVCARVGGVVAAFVVQRAVNEHAPEFPLTVFGILAGIAGFLVMFLPETWNKVMPETLEQADSFGRIQLPCCRKKSAILVDRSYEDTSASSGDMNRALLADDSDDDGPHAWLSWPFRRSRPRPIFRRVSIANVTLLSDY